MVITIEEARKLLGKASSKYSDQQVEEMINTLSLLSDLAIDSWLAKTPEERRKFKEEYIKNARQNKEPFK